MTSLAQRLTLRAKWEITRLRDNLGDARLGVSTAWERPKGAMPKGWVYAPYEAIPYRGLRMIEERLHLTAKDTVVDIGCGKGRVVCWFARLPIALSLGVDYDPQLAAQATENAGRMRGRQAPVEILTGDAREQDYGPATAIIMYNPFSAQIMRELLQRIDANRASRPTRIVYVNPTAAAELDACAWLKRTDSFTIPHALVPLKTVIWTSVS